MPLLDEWLISGSVLGLGADQADEVLAQAAAEAMRVPSLLFRNPERLRIGWQMQAEDRSRFVEFFGADLVVVPLADWARRWGITSGCGPGTTLRSRVPWLSCVSCWTARRSD